MKNLNERIKASGMRLTNPRKRLTAVLESADRPMSAEEIMASESQGALDLVTVYRNLAAFCEHGFVQTLHLENGKQLFEIQRGEHDHHHHIICRKCHSVIRLDLCFGNELEKYARDKGFTEVTHAFEIYGVCPDCAKRKPGPRD
jgi:Fe2+ or Zn2+ uptake regulation protein